MLAVPVKVTVTVPPRSINVRPIILSGNFINREHPIRQGSLSIKGYLIGPGPKDNQVADSYETLINVTVHVSVRRQREVDSRVNPFLLGTRSWVGSDFEGSVQKTIMPLKGANEGIAFVIKVSGKRNRC